MIRRESDGTGPDRGKAGVAAIVRGRFVYSLASVVLLIPCYWQSRLQAGDLSSHLYNAWLAQLITKGQAPGIEIAGQSTNVLFDLMLGGLFNVVGAAAAQRISVSLAVLVFVWGAFAFVSEVGGRPAWSLMPSVAVLAYGWVFHIGFFNYYLSLGLCFWFLALAWNGVPLRIAAGVPLLAIAYVAHGLPVTWAVAVLAYARLARRLEPRHRAWLLTASLGAIVVLRAAVSSRMVTIWSRNQIRQAVGLDQAWVFDDKYLLPLVGLLLLWGLQFLRTVRQSGPRALFSSAVFQVCALTAAGIVIFPNAVLVPGYKHQLAYIADRMSLASGIAICALLGAARASAWERSAMLASSLLFFGFLYRDELILNGVEDQMERAVAQVPAGQRVVSALGASGLRVNALTHMIDRVCVGRCYSYANYEPTTAAFRVRAVAQNSIVVTDYVDSWLLQVGRYVVKDRDLPLYQVTLDVTGRMSVRSMTAGVPCGAIRWNPL